MVFNYDAVARTSSQDCSTPTPASRRCWPTTLRTSGIDHDLHVIVHSGGSELAYELLLAMGHVRQVTLLEASPKTLKHMVADWPSMLPRFEALEKPGLAALRHRA